MDIIFKNEICKPIPGFSRYHISISGRVYRTKPSFHFEERLLEKAGKTIVFHEVSTKLNTHSKNHQYLRCAIRNDDGVLTTSTVAFLVALAFGILPEQHKYYQTVHINGDPENCHVDNLTYIQKQPRNSILEKEDIPEIRKLIEKGIPLRKIATMFGVCEMQIGRIKTGENWNNGRLKIKPPKLPFEVEDPKIRRLLTHFELYKIQSDNQKSAFTIKRNDQDATKNIIIGRIMGYRLTNTHKNISRARDIVDKLNRYFFNDIIADRLTEKLSVGMHKSLTDLAPRTSISH